MNHIKLIATVFLTASFMSGCGSSSSKRMELNKSDYQVDPVAEGYSIIFYKLDDFAKVYLDDKMIFDTEEIAGMAPKSEVLLDLTPFLKKGTNTIKVELYNAQCADCNLNRWSIFYEIFEGDESLEFVSEDSNDQNDDLGIKLTNTHQIELP